MEIQIYKLNKKFIKYISQFYSKCLASPCLVNFPLVELLLQISAPRSNILFRAVHLVSSIVGPVSLLPLLLVLWLVLLLLLAAS